MKTSTSGDPRVNPKATLPSATQWSSDDEDPLLNFYERKVTYQKSTQPEQAVIVSPSADAKKSQTVKSTLVSKTKNPESGTIESGSGIVEKT